jgi:ribosomal protein S27AE
VANLVSGYNPITKTYDASLEAAVTVFTQNQNDRSLFMGDPGSGKSIMALSYDYNCAKLLSLFHHKEWDKWENFFNLDDHMACADRDKLIHIIQQDFPANTILLADELQMMVNSRDYKDMGNRIVNLFYQLIRPKRYIITGTIQEQFAQDKQSRRLYSKMNDMGHLHAYNYGVNFGRTQYVRMDPKNPSKTLFPYPRENGKVINMLAGVLPPKKLVSKYEKIREDSIKKVRDEKIDEFNKLNEIKRIKEERVLNETLKQGGCPSCGSNAFYATKDGKRHCKKCSEVY